VKTTRFERMFQSNFGERILSKFLTLVHPHFLNSRITYALNVRDHRIHPFVEEALSLVPTKVKVFTDLVEVENNRLSGKFRKYGSDKEDRHSYSWVYADLIGSNSSPKILEIGLGSLNGFPYGGLTPGGSIKAWRDGYPEATIVGADIDKEAVEAIDEFGIIVDQTSDYSLGALRSKLDTFNGFDLIVDDGFHDPHANIRTYLMLHECVVSGGFFVIEDVHFSLLNFWRVIGACLPGTLKIYDLRNQRPNCEDNILLVFCL
jgi:hypothetical protein